MDYRTQKSKKKITSFTKRITIQKNTISTDKYRNHTPVWTEYFSCWTYAVTYQFDQENAGAVTRPEQTVNFEVRYCSELKDLNSTEYRVLFENGIYNIISVDMMNYQFRTIRIRCKYEGQMKS